MHENFNKYVGYKYVLDSVSYMRSGKFGLSCAIKFPLLSHEKTLPIETNRIANLLGSRTINITKQGTSDKLMRIGPQVYIDMNNDAMSQIYNDTKQVASFKGFIVSAINGSIIEIPNVKITREEFGIPENTILKSHTSTARISCMAYTKNEFILSPSISYKDKIETEHASNQWGGVENRTGMAKVITPYGRGHASTELMLKP